MVVIENVETLEENPDLKTERQNANFDTYALSCLIWGGKENFKRRNEIATFVENTPELKNQKPIAFMNRFERLENAARLSVELFKHQNEVIDPNNFQEAHIYKSLVHGTEMDPFHLHYVMGLPSLLNNGDAEQQNYWIPKILNREICLTYAQTELGHGTNLSKLETTAIYVPETEEFILNSPTITSIKWWPGYLGKSANWAIVLAILKTNNGKKSHGPHQFLVQLRDYETHLPLPGIIVGDIGPKFGYTATDNGFLRFENFRIPRKQMLMKHAKVSKEGVYEKPIHSKLSYTSMMFVRSVLIKTMSLDLAKAVTIAIRYSCVRRQGEIQIGAGEVKILDYQSQQFRLFPQLARVFAFFFAGEFIQDLYFSVMADINSGDVSLLADLHALSSGLKAQVSYQVTLGIEQCRMACGGHGYSDASGLPILYAQHVPACTYEGENMVMLLQMGKYLVKQAQKFRSGQIENNPSPIAKYLFEFEQNRQDKFSLSEGPIGIIKAFEHLSARLTLWAYDRLKDLMGNKSGYSYEEAWNLTSVDWMKASRAHTRTFLARKFFEKVLTLEANNSSLNNVLQNLLKLYLNYELIECSGGLLEDGYLDGNLIHKIRQNVYDSLIKIRPQAVPIVDSFGFFDRELDSILGRKDGNVYENLLKWAQSSPLNETEVLPFHEKYNGKAMREARLKAKL